MENYIKIINEVWPELAVTPEPVGSGKYGVVYHCCFRKGGIEADEAVKVISIPKDEEDYEEAEDLDLDPAELFLDKKNRAVNEIEAMEKLKSPYVVHINGFEVRKQKNDIGWDILIRMDYLRDIKKVLNKNAQNFTKAEAEDLAYKIGDNIGKALSACEKQSIIHRDIKPDNIFTSDKGDYYLGDFGISKVLDTKTFVLSSKGTELYLAPEVASGHYDGRVDLYSLGMVLYRVVNHGRLPFEKRYPEKRSATETVEIQLIRKEGKPVPLPDNCDRPLGEIICKLCAFDPGERYLSADDFLDSLNVSRYGKRLIDETAKNTDYPIKNAEIKTEKKERENTGDSNRVEKKDITPKASQSKERRKEPNRYNETSFTPNNRKPESHHKKPGMGSFVISVVLVLIIAGISAVLMLKENNKHNKIDETHVSSEEVAGSSAPVEIKEEVVETSAPVEAKEEVAETSAPVETEEETEKAISNTTEEKESEDLKLENAEIVESKNLYNTTVEDTEDSLGNKLESAFKVAMKGEGNFSYNLDGNYKYFRGEIHLDDDTKQDEDVKIRIYADDIEAEPLFTAEMTRTSEPALFDLDVSEVKILTIEIEPKHAFDTFDFVNAVFSNDEVSGDSSSINESTEEIKEELKLEDTKIVQSKQVSKTTVESTIDSLGNKLESAFKVDMDGKGHFSYNLNRNYKYFRGEIHLDDDTEPKEKATIKIYADDNESEPLFTTEMTRASEPAVFDLDVSEVRILTIEIEPSYTREVFDFYNAVFSNI